jgi:histidine kinase
MFHLLDKLGKSFVSKLILAVGLTLLLTISAWAYLNVKYQEEKVMQNILTSTDRLTNTIRLGTHYAMMLNSRDDINQIIRNIGKQPEIKNIRIYNKEGQIKYSNHVEEVDQITNIKAEACDVCHRSDPPLTNLDLNQRTRILHSPTGYRLLGIISPICNEPSCATGECHVHPEGKTILGAMDVVISLQDTDAEILTSQKGMIGFAAFAFCITSAIIFIFVLRFVNHPIKRLIEGTQAIARGNYRVAVNVDQGDEMGQLAQSITYMGNEIATSQAELKKQRDEYQNLFEQVPCLITVQDRNYRLLRYNGLFSERFRPTPGDFCYRAYKGLSEKCKPCPVEMTFADGRSHYAEESGMDRDGTTKHWIVRTSPIKDAEGNITAAMEISLDITQRKNLENELEKSEEKYHAIFNNIPNPVFVLDVASLEILDCNESVQAVYGFKTGELAGRGFLDLFYKNDSDDYRRRIKSKSVINQAKQKGKDGRLLFVDIRISPSEYSGRKVFLVTTSDITKRLETEQQLIQASKMATLGEMATGIAHELNQPLSVIKTVSSFFLKKLGKQEPIEETVIHSMLEKVDGNVDRAANIINHMRQFARKSDTKLEKVQANAVIRSAFEIFSQQLKVRGIDVHWEIDEDLPDIHADAGRLEQVFINLLLNARDAIEEYRENTPSDKEDASIMLSTRVQDEKVICSVCDTGAGIQQDVADKIFEPFFTTKEVGKGTGLGLSISYGIVQDCGGRITARPNPPRGACFVLTFPVPGADAIERMATHG